MTLLEAGRNRAEIRHVGLSPRAMSGGCGLGSQRLGFQRSLPSEALPPPPFHDAGGLHQRIFVESGKQAEFSQAQTPPPPDPDFTTTLEGLGPWCLKKHKTHLNCVDTAA